jgi:hypothetical protein
MDPALPQMLLGEAQGLEALRCATELLKVPKVLHVGNRRDGAELSRRAFLIFFSDHKPRINQGRFQVTQVWGFG